MKKILLRLAVLLFFATPSFLQAQDAEYDSGIPKPAEIAQAQVADPRVLAAFGSKYVDEISKGDKFWLYKWNFYVQKAYYVSDSPEPKMGADFAYPEVTISDLNNINILILEKNQALDRDFHSETYYKIVGSDKYLVYRSGEYMSERFNIYWEAVRAASKD
jgi:hypothetical protein